MNAGWVGVRMGQRRALHLVIAVTLLAAALWATPWMRPRPVAPVTSAATPEAAAPEAPAPWPALAGTGDDARLRQQLEFARLELAEREERVAVREAALRGELQRGFWARQALVGALTLALAALAVPLLLKRGIGWSALREQLRADESRLQRLQLSVIDGLQAFEASLAGARAEGAAASSGAGEAGREELTPDRARRLVLAEAPATARPQPQAAPARAPARADRPVRLVEAIEEEQMWPALEPRPLESEPYAPEEGFVAADALEPDAPLSRPRDAWAKRLFAPEPRAEAPDPRGAGLWSEPARRPVPPPRETRALPSARAQIEYLAAGGLGEAEIARRLRLSREEVHTALALGGYTEAGSRGGMEA